MAARESLTLPPSFHSTGGIICDVREPYVVRVAPTALYNSFKDVGVFVEGLRSVLIESQNANAGIPGRDDVPRMDGKL